MRFKLMAWLVLLSFCASCATLQGSLVHPTGRAITNSVGNPDLAKYKTFTIASTAAPNTAEFLHDVPILANIGQRFQQEGFRFVPKIEDADILVTMSFVDAVGQDYVPPQTYTSVSYDPGITTTSTTGTAMAMGNFVHFDATSQSTSTSSMSTTTTTTGGYFVPSYGIAISLNVYDRGTKHLLWSGSGARRAGVSDVRPAVDDIVLTLIDRHLITPSYLKGERERIRTQALERHDEYLKPNVPTDKVGYYKVAYKDVIDGVQVLSDLKTEGVWLTLTLSLANKSTEEVEFDQSRVKVSFQGEPLYIFSKSEIAGAFFKSPSSTSGTTSTVASGLPGLLAKAIGDSIRASQEQKKDRAVRFIYEHYLESSRIKPGATLLGFLYISAPMVMNDGDHFTVSIPVGHKDVPVEYIFEKGWMPVEKYRKMYSGK